MKREFDSTKSKNQTGQTEKAPACPSKKFRTDETEGSNIVEAVERSEEESTQDGESVALKSKYSDVAPKKQPENEESGPQKKRQKRNYGDYFNSLPEELLMHILSFFSTRQLVRMLLVSKDWRRLADDDNLWESLAEREGMEFRSFKKQLFLIELNKGVYVDNILLACKRKDLDAIEHFHAVAIQLGLKTYPLFRSVLNKCEDMLSRTEHLSLEDKLNIYSSILCYFATITRKKDGCIMFNFNSPDTGGYIIHSIRLSGKDYFGIKKLTEEILKNPEVDLDKPIAGWLGKEYEFTGEPTPLFYATSTYIGEDIHPDDLRLCHWLIRLLIETGAEESKLKLRNVSLFQFLIVYEVLFADDCKRFDTEPEGSIFSKVNRDDEKSVYSKFIGFDNIKVTSNKPLSADFMKLAEIFLKRGEEVPSYEEFKRNCLEGDNDAKEELVGNFDRQLDAKVDEIFKNALKQLEELSLKLSQQKSSKSC